VFENVATMTPNEMQKQILDLIHERRIVEHLLENGESAPSKTCCPEPLLRLIHGLPGSGKTQVLRWLQSYFEEVWSWTLGLEFVFTAPLNSMASNIGGSTIHSWGQIGFKDRRGTLINCQQKSNEEVPSMATQCEAVRFLFIDEIEAAGAETLGSLENNLMSRVSLRSPWRYKADGKTVRPFAGVNVPVVQSWLLERK
jgi:hypothetical protein